MLKHTSGYPVAVIGAGPAGIFAARELALAGIPTFLFNRDIKPGGLAEYGIFPDKIKMKEGLRAQFRQILALDSIHYFGNIRVGSRGDLTLPEICGQGFQAVLVTSGAQGTKWLGLDGERLPGSYHAKDIVYYYNRLPPFSLQELHIGRRVAIVGAGNVSLDIARWMITHVKAEEVVLVVRRGPAEVKFDRGQLEYVAANLDLEDTTRELERVFPVMQTVGEGLAPFRKLLAAAREHPAGTDSSTRLTLRFLSAPVHLEAGADGHVCGLEVEDTTLVEEHGEVRAHPLGTRCTLNVDTVIFAIGDSVDADFGLPVHHNEFIKNPNPLFPVDGVSYEIYDPFNQDCPQNIFVAGWSRKASSGLVGLARKDGVNGARALMQYLETRPPADELRPSQVEEYLRSRGRVFVRQVELERLEAAEQSRANSNAPEGFKFSTNEEMLRAAGLG